MTELYDDPHAVANRARRRAAGTRERSIASRFGPILAATAVCPDPEGAAAAYHAAFDYGVRDRGTVAPALARLWNAPRAAGRGWVMLGPGPGPASRPDGAAGGRPSGGEGGAGEAGLIRLVEGPAPAPPPLTAFGWAAAELTVAEDLDALARRLPAAGFRVVGPPRPLGSNPAIRAMQVAGPAGEVLYLTDIRAYDGPLDLARPRRPVDRVFIAVLAAPDMAAARGWYEARFGAPRVSGRRVAVPVLNACQGRPAEAETPIGSVALAGGCLIECDGYPPGSPAAAAPAGELRGGWAMVTVAVEALAPDLAAAARSGLPGPPYHGRRTACLAGAAGERVELVEAAP